MELNDKQRTLQQRLFAAAHRMYDAQGKYARLKALCQHAFVQRGDSAECAVCGEHGGWWCPDSEKHLCVYSDSFDSCDFCGQPEERK